MPATTENLLASPEPFWLPRGALRRLLSGAGYCGNPSRFFGAVSAAFEWCRLLRKSYSLLQSRFGGFRGALRRLLRVAGYRGKPSRFSGVVSTAPGGVETAFERCWLPRKLFSLLRSRFGGSGGALKRLLRVADYRGKPSRFPGAISSAPGAVETAFEWCRLLRKSSLKPFRRLWGGVEVAFESCRLPRKPFSLLVSRFGGPGGR